METMYPAEMLRFWTVGQKKQFEDVFKVAVNLPTLWRPNLRRPVVTCRNVSLPISQLSDNILTGLHEISSCVASQNYQRGLEVHTQVVSNSNFSESSAFMPILKVVMTIANKLGV